MKDAEAAGREPAEVRGRSWSDYLRWSLIFLLLGFGFVGSASGSFEVCRDEVGDDEPVSLCGPPAPTDLVVLAGLGLVLALGMPDLSEGSIGGVISFKRRLQKAEERAEAQASQIEMLRLSIGSESKAAASAQGVVVLAESSLRDLPEEILQKRRGEPPRPKQRRAEDDREYAKAVLRLINSWEELQERIGPPARWRGIAEEYDHQAQRQARFQEQYVEELRLVRAARNAVAHGQPLELRTVMDAERGAHELIAAFDSY